jgi:predicted site-specific integrase-resolvase
MTKLISPKQAARLVYVSRETITYWVKTGRLQKHPYPLSQRSKEIYKRDNGVRYYLVSEEEVIAVARERFAKTAA